MKFLSLQPFVPSGKDLEKSKQFFTELGFIITFDAGGYVGFERDGCRFILQQYDNRDFAENFMISVAVTNAQEFYDEVSPKMLDEKFGIKLTKPIQQPYGKEVNIIDLAGVCWHFVES
jgi:predicted lactoylglutathione lyase